MKIILASASPRRRELLSKVFDDFKIMVSDTDENLDDSVHPRDGVRILSVRKGKAVYDTLSEEEKNEALIISSDTLVEIFDKPLGKPTSVCDAQNMLRTLSGKRHNVHTGIALHYKGKVYAATATTGVYFREITDEQIDEYIATGEPMDKAGSYGIQGIGGKFVTSIDGDYDTVVGFSLRLLKELLKEANVDI